MTENGLAEIMKGSVLDSAEILEEYSSDLSFAPRLRPRYVVKPGSVTEVQALIKWANETLTTLVPMSSGPPHFRGDTVPSGAGAVIVDLSGMKQIMRIDGPNRIAMIEAGVTFHELIGELAKQGLRLNLPFLPRKNKSVIGSMLEREPVIMPLYQWDAIDPLTCIEVIFGSGDPFRTGSAAGPGSLEDQWKSKQAQVNPMGPGQTDFARVVQGSQGTIGIVTWATVRCEGIPSLQKPFLAGADSLDELTDFIYQTMWLKCADTSLVLNNITLASAMAKSGEEYEELKGSLPQWVYFFSLAGFEYFPEDRIAYQEKDMLEAAMRSGLKPSGALPGISAYEVLNMTAKPSDEPYWKLRHKGACQDVFFLTTLDRVPNFIEIVNDIADRKGYPVSEMGIYVQPMVQGTSCHCEFELFYDPNNAREAQKVRDLSIQASEAIMNNGGFFSRPYGEISDMVFRRDGNTMAALKKTKEIFDPRNIMNTGKLCF